MTAEEFGLKHAGDRVEYVNGQVREVPMAGAKHGKVCWHAAEVIGGFIERNALGHLFINDTFVRVPTRSDPQRVYGADVAYVPFERLPREAEVPDGVIPATPALVVEVRSPSDTWTAAFGKVVDYLGAGVPVVLLLDPGTRTATVYGDEFGQRTFGAGDVLSLPEVLPGFTVPVADLFR
jgi:Uma2 family endonuclease